MPPRGEITMTSYPVGNISSLSRKPCIPDKQLLWNAIKKSWSLFQNPSHKITWSTPGEEITMTSYPACNKTSYLGNHASQIKSFYGKLTGTYGRSFRIRHEKSREEPLAAKSRWRHGRLAIKPHKLGNHTTQKKSCYGTLTGSHGRYFRIRHAKLSEAPPCEKIAMTSYPACNKTSLYRKPCIPDKKLLWNTIRTSWSLFQNPSLKSPEAPPAGEIPMTSYLAMNPRYLTNHASQINE